MTEKLNEYEITSRDGPFINAECNTKIINTLVRKINELVDVVNKLETMAKNTNTVLKSLAQESNIHEKQIDELQMKVEPEKLSQFVNAADLEKQDDPYAEQRKWIGRLCKFWDYVYDRDYFDTLKGITDDGLFIGHNGCWKYCEPVKPEDDIIYKE